MDDEGTILDVTPGRFEDIDRRVLEGSGHRVLVCHGPDDETPCPVLAGHCELLDSAHGVVFQLDLANPMHRAILRRYREELDPETPLAAVIRPGQETQYAELLEGLKVWTHSPTVGELDGFAAEVEAVDRSEEG